MSGAWSSPIYQQTVLLVLSFLFAAGAVVFALRQRSYYFIVSWASIKSWLLAAPIFFGLFGLPEPWPLAILTLLALLGTKIFLQLMGMYHRSYFVFTSYAGVLGLAACVHIGDLSLYNLVPMLVLGGCCLVPLVRNNYVRMIQYISITNLGFVFLGWSFMHLAWIAKFDQGLYQLMYLVILTEFCDNTNLAISRSVGRTRLFDRIEHRRSFESTACAVGLTLLVAFAMRHLLPDQGERYWLSTGLIASLGGVFGDLVMTVIRRDAGIKVVGAFVWGRGDFLQRMDRLIFVAPIYFYLIRWLPLGHL